MGLDVYLYTRAQNEASGRYEAQIEAFCEREDWASEEVKEAARKELPSWEGHTDVPSERYPDHLFNRRYLRSSYNGSGFNRSVPDMVGEDHGLYWIFEPVRLGDEYETELTAASVEPLKEVKKRALQVAEELRTCDPIRTMSEGLLLGGPAHDHMWRTPPTEGDALAWYREQQAEHAGREVPSPFGESYSNAKGLVLGFTAGTEVLALVAGRDVLGKPAAIAVYRLGKEAVDSYVQSAEITAEFCDEAISLITADGSCFMHWSG